MKTRLSIMLLLALLLLGCDGKPPDGNGSKTCPSTCQYGCLPDNVTCASPPANLCKNVTCLDKCEDENILDTNGQCDNATGSCTYRKSICVFGCENDSCRKAPLCPETCPFGCEPGTDVCRSAVCPDYCRYGCIPGTIQCNSEPPSSGIKNGDFEEGYTGWNVTGIAFGSAPSDGALANSRGLYQNVPYSGYSGAYFASSYLPNMDKAAMGNITSEPFFINKKYLEFLVIGQLSGQIYVELIVNKTVVHHLEPDNPFSPFRRVVWNLSAYGGKSGVIKVVDLSNRNYIEVDDFRLVDTPSPNAGERYVDRNRNFSVIPPLNWVVGPGTQQGQLFMYGSRENNYTNQITIMSENVDASETTESYFAKGKTGLALLLQNYSVVSESNVNIGGLDAEQIDYTYVLTNITLRSREVFLVHDNIGYKISAIAAEKSFARHSDEFDACIKSFELAG